MEQFKSETGKTPSCNSKIELETHWMYVHCNTL
jgi:hypothetical protein